ncbi:hypothetical protein LOZ58_005035 [Ophidiomyces ophidiicola]|nr:hypothetical protein LOZ58_005035 [Ophidiomyces ophidiicola]
MILLPCLLVAGTLSTGVSAFYPVKIPEWDAPSPPSSNRRRFFPVSLPKVFSPHESTSLSFDIVKVPTMSRRENKYSAIMSSEPTMKNSIAINQDGSDYSYFSVVKVGSKGQKMWMLLDSGASESWMMGSNCTSPACLKHNTFGREASDTLNITNKDWRVTYGTGHVEGIIAEDTLSLAGFNVRLAFGYALKASDDFLNYPMDGILGLGPSKATKVPPFLQVIAGNKLLKKNVLGINLQRAADGTNDGQMVLGDVDKSKFTGDIIYTKIIKETNRWEIPIDDALVDGKTIKFTNKSAVIDTGTSFILIPMKDAEAIHALIPGSKKDEDYFKIPCNTNTSVEIMISGVKWTISPKDYVGSGRNNVCNSYILGQQPLGPDQWLLGDTFLKNVYSVFDYDESKIGFANRKSSGPSSAGNMATPSSTTSRSSSSESTASPVPPQDVNNKPIAKPTQSTPANSPEHKGAAAFISTPSWPSLLLLFSAWHSWHLLYHAFL